MSTPRGTSETSTNNSVGQPQPTVNSMANSQVSTDQKDYLTDSVTVSFNHDVIIVLYSIFISFSLSVHFYHTGSKTICTRGSRSSSQYWYLSYQQSSATTSISDTQSSTLTTNERTQPTLNAPYTNYEWCWAIHKQWYH